MYRTNKRNLTVKQKKTIHNPLLNINIITTPYEKVLSILLNIKQFISNLIKDKSKLINDIDYCIKIITSHSLYSYELKDTDAIKELSTSIDDKIEFTLPIEESKRTLIKFLKEKETNKKYPRKYSIIKQRPL